VLALLQPPIFATSPPPLYGLWVLTEKLGLEPAFVEKPSQLLPFLRIGIGAILFYAGEIDWCYRLKGRRDSKVIRVFLFFLPLCDWYVAKIDRVRV